MTARHSNWTWAAPAATLVIGAAVLAAEAANGDPLEGLVWFALLGGLAAVLVFGRRFEWVRLARGEDEDERQAMINERAMAAAGLVLVIALTAVIVFQVARGEDPSPYTQLASLGGSAYLATLIVLHRRS
jgi:hypothetical protein